MKQIFEVEFTGGIITKELIYSLLHDYFTKNGIQILPVDSVNTYFQSKVLNILTIKELKDTQK